MQQRRRCFFCHSPVMRKRLPLTLLLLALIGCAPVRHAYYLSPTNASSHPYHAIPMKNDSLKSAWYGSVLYSTGTSNDLGNDNLWSFEARIHRSHNFSIFQAYYGLNVVMGNYDVSDYYRANYDYRGGLFGIYPTYFDTTYHIQKSSDFYGTYGFSGGINFVIPFDNRRGGSGEWRALGLETSVQQEFGNYLQFRKTLPDTVADVIFRKSVTGSWGIYTEIVGKNRHNTEFGFRIAYGRMFNPKSNFSVQTYFANNNSVIDNSIPISFPLAYLSMAFHVTKSQITGFFQLTGGTYSTCFQTGVNYRIGKGKKK